MSATSCAGLRRTAGPIARTTRVVPGSGRGAISSFSPQTSLADFTDTTAHRNILATALALASDLNTFLLIQAPSFRNCAEAWLGRGSPTCHQLTLQNGRTWAMTDRCVALHTDIRVPSATRMSSIWRIRGKREMAAQPPLWVNQGCLAVKPLTVCPPYQAWSTWSSGMRDKILSGLRRGSTTPAAA